MITCHNETNVQYIDSIRIFSFAPSLSFAVCCSFIIPIACTGTNVLAQLKTSCPIHLTHPPLRSACHYINDPQADFRFRFAFNDSKPATRTINMHHTDICTPTPDREKRAHHFSTISIWLNAMQRKSIHKFKPSTDASSLFFLFHFFPSFFVYMHETP